jgi:hypothetical protein
MMVATFRTLWFRNQGIHARLQHPTKASRRAQIDNWNKEFDVHLTDPTSGWIFQSESSVTATSSPPHPNNSPNAESTAVKIYPEGLPFDFRWSFNSEPDPADTQKLKSNGGLKPLVVLAKLNISHTNIQFTQVHFPFPNKSNSSVQERVLFL